MLARAAFCLLVVLGARVTPAPPDPHASLGASVLLDPPRPHQACRSFKAPLLLKKTPLEV